MADGTVTGMHHLALTVRDLDTSASWYEGLFDLDAAGVGHPGRIDIPFEAILNFPDPDGIQLSTLYEGD